VRGNSIILTSNPKGVFLEGIIDDTSKPGTMMEITPTTGPTGGRPHFRHYQPSADGDPRMVAVLLEDDLQGFPATTAYVAGSRCRIYVPLPGEEMNVLVRDIAGTGDTHTIGDRFEPGHADGKLIVQSTSANVGTFTAMETVPAPTADMLLWCMRT
jgi:hypothetical protein